MKLNQPPLEIFRVDTYVDNRGRVIVAKMKVGAVVGGITISSPDTPIHTGQGTAAVRTPQGVHQVPFEIPLPGPTLHEAFDQFDAAQEPAFKAHMEKLRIEAIKHGPDWSQLPRPERN